MLILGIDTSGKTASAALCRNGEILAESYTVTERAQSQVILPITDRVLSDAGVTLGEIDCIAVAKGPGSYTGLRIGIAAAKGISFANGCMCAGISTLEALAYNFMGISFPYEPHVHIYTIMHARQELYYTAEFRLEHNGTISRATADRIITLDDAAQEVCFRAGYIYITGNGTDELCRNLRYFPVKNWFPAAPHMRTVWAESLCLAAMNSELVPADRLNPEYLQITKAEKDLLNKSLSDKIPLKTSEAEKNMR